MSEIGTVSWFLLSQKEHHSHTNMGAAGLSAAPVRTNENVNSMLTVDALDGMGVVSESLGGWLAGSTSCI